MEGHDDCSVDGSVVLSLMVQLSASCAVLSVLLLLVDIEVVGNVFPGYPPRASVKRRREFRKCGAVGEVSSGAMRRERPARRVALRSERRERRSWR